MVENYTVVRLYNKVNSRFNHASFCDKITFTCIDRQRHAEKRIKKPRDRDVDGGLYSKYVTYIHR